MPRTEDVLTIFLASPGDVEDERSRFAEAIVDWNRAWSRNLGLRLELVRWEDDAFPAVGEDAQEVINQQLPPDYDLFVGLMWSRFGTPTGRADSGTKEEFDRALERHKHAPGSINILFYFKDAPISPSKLDPSQLAKVQDFRRSLSDVGVLSWEFTDTDQFERLVSLHITKHVQAWRQNRDQATMPVQAEGRSLEPIGASPVASEQHTIDDDSGYIDLLEVFAERSAEMSEIALRLSAAQRELTEQSAKGRQELDDLRARPHEVSAVKVRRGIGRVADEMLRFTSRVEAELPLFRAAADSSMSALVRAATVVVEFDPEQARSTKEAAFQLLATLAQARLSTQDFRASTAGLPRMTKELNIAKRKQVAALERLAEEFENAERLLAEGLGVIDGLLGSQPSPSLG